MNTTGGVHIGEGDHKGDLELYLQTDSQGSRVSSNGVVAVDGSGMVKGRHAASRQIAGQGCEFFQPNLREFSATLIGKQVDGQGFDNSGGAQGGGQGGSPGDSDTTSQEQEALAAENEQLVKDFMLLLDEYFNIDGRKVGAGVELRLNTSALGTRRGPPSSSSEFRGVTRHRRTKKWESHIWYNKKQLYLGGFKVAVEAAKAHDIMGLKLKKSLAHTNFEPHGYAKLVPYLEKLTMGQVMEALRLCSKGTGDSRHLKQRLPKSVHGRRNSWHAGNLNNPTMGAMDRDMPLVRVSGGVVDTIHATLLPQSWSREGKIMAQGHDAASRLSTSELVDCMCLPAPMATSSDFLDAQNWTPINCRADGHCMEDSTTSPYMVTGRSTNEALADATSHHIRTDLLFEQNVERGRVGLGQHQGQADNRILLATVPQCGTEYMAASITPSNSSALGCSLQELLNGDPSQASNTVPPGHKTLFQTPEALIVKVPVIQSKVISCPSGAQLTSPNLPISHMPTVSQVQAPSAQIPDHLFGSLMNLMPRLGSTSEMVQAPQMSQQQQPLQHPVKPVMPHLVSSEVHNSKILMGDGGYPYGAMDRSGSGADVGRGGVGDATF